MKYLLLLLIATHIMATSISYRCYTMDEEVESVILQASEADTSTMVHIDGDYQIVLIPIQDLVSEEVSADIPGYGELVFYNCQEESLLFGDEHTTHTCYDNNNQPFLVEYTSDTASTVEYRGVYYSVPHSLEHIVIDGYQLQLDSYTTLEYSGCHSPEWYDEPFEDYDQYAVDCDREAGNCD